MREGEVRPRRCAIYTRKSTDEGLDQAFNSLDAQREACAAYVMSQAHEGWRLDTTIYDDGGFSGGNLQRPALTCLLAEVRAGRIDVIVVYKIDRLTRSLADFAKIVEILDSSEASFVSVTQSFNTTTSMGRLTLNVLLSFAQFEREVISERVRDKVAASKRKGMWMGGVVPLGYRIESRMLVIDNAEARTVRHIMESYLASRSVMELAERLKSAGIVSKAQILRNGTTRGGVPYSRGALYCLLKNRIYVGEITHKDKVYPGQHKGIIDRDLFDAIQRKLSEATPNTKRGPRKTAPSLLTGCIRDDHGRPMSPTHSAKQGKRYRYYTSNNPEDVRPSIRVAAGDLDAAVISAVVRLLSDQDRICDLATELDALNLKALNRSCRDLAVQLPSLSFAEQLHMVRELDLQVRVQARTVDISISFADVLELAKVDGFECHPTERLQTDFRLDGFAYGHEARVRIAPTGAEDAPRSERVADLVVAAVAARDQLQEMTTIDRNCTTIRHLQRMARLAYLDPAIIAALLDETLALKLGARDLLRMPSLPLCWAEHRKLVGLA